MMVFLAAPVSQIDGSRFQYANCGPAVTSELITLATVDALKVSAARVRTATGDTSGGVEGSVLAVTASKLSGLPFYYLRESDFADVRALLERGSLGIIIDCSRTIRTRYRTNSFTGLHWWTLAGGTIKDGTVKAEDPGTTSAGWFRVPLQLVREASLINGYHWLLKAPPTEGVRKSAVMRAAVRTLPDKTTRILRRLDKGDEVNVRRTRKGGSWRRADGTTAHGWHQLANGGYVKGEALR